MAEETRYTANNGMIVISTANSNLDGTGTLGTVLTAASNGTFIKTVYIKSQGVTTDGMVRLFITGGGNTRLLQEIKVSAQTPSGTDMSFEARITLNYTLQSGYKLEASTQKAETFGIIADGLDWSYFSNGVRDDTTEFTAITGLTSMNTSNGNLNGSGSLALLYLYNSVNGIKIESITIKAAVSTTPGMVRLFLQNSGATKTILFSETYIPSVTKSGIAPSFEHTIVFENGFDLQNNYSLYASTEKGELFKLYTVGLARSYAA